MGQLVSESQKGNVLFETFIVDRSGEYVWKPGEVCPIKGLIF